MNATKTYSGNRKQKPVAGRRRPKQAAPPVAGGDDERLAAILASQLAREIVGGQLPVNTLLGTEADLMERFQVSRDPLREAIRILEWQGLVTASRGRSGGGLRVAASPDAAVSNLLRTYLQLSDISLGEVLEAIGVLQDYLLTSVAQRPTRAQIARMRHLVAAVRPQFEQGSTDISVNGVIVEEIIRAAPNLLARLLARALVDTCIDFAHAGRLPRTVPGANMPAIEHFEKIIDAIERRDTREVLRLHHQMLRDGAEGLSDLERRDSAIWNTQSFLMGDYNEALVHISGRQKLATAIGYQVAAYLRRNELPEGKPVTLNEAGVDESGTSRAVQREAIRLLEFFGVLDVRRGNEGGLYTMHPSPARVIAFTHIYFSQMPIAARQLSQIRDHLGQAAVRLCAHNLTTSGLLEIRCRMERFHEKLDAAAARVIAIGIGRLIFVYSGNRALLLFGELLFALAQDQSYQRAARVYRPSQIARRYAEIVTQLTTAFLNSQEHKLADTLKALLEVITEQV